METSVSKIAFIFIIYCFTPMHRGHKLLLQNVQECSGGLIVALWLLGLINPENQGALAC